MTVYPDDPYSTWRRRHGVAHGHCPEGCEHPQPVGLPDGRLVCGRCLILDGVVSEMIPCTPAACGE